MPDSIDRPRSTTPAQTVLLLKGATALGVLLFLGVSALLPVLGSSSTTPAIAWGAMPAALRNGLGLLVLAAIGWIAYWRRRAAAGTAGNPMTAAVLMFAVPEGAALASVVGFFLYRDPTWVIPALLVFFVSLAPTPGAAR